MSKFSSLAALLSIIVLMTSMALATEVCGNVSGVWDSTGSPYYVTCNLVIPEGESLFIEPGVEVLFNDNFKIDVLGVLWAAGTEQDSIVFLPSPSNTNQRWRGIRVGTSKAFCSLDYCVVAHAWKGNGNDYDSNGGGLICWWSTTVVDHSTFHHNTATRGSAIALYSGGSWVSNSLFTDNTATYGGALWIGEENTISQCTFYSNSIPTNRATVHLGGAGIINSSIIGWSSHYAIDFGGGTARADYCDFSNNYSGTYSGSGPAGFAQRTTVNARGDSCDQYHNIFRDPNFLDPQNYDFHLTLESRCIDAGDPALPHDPDGSIADIGAFRSLGARGLSLDYPNGGEVWRIGNADTIRWTPLGVSGLVRIALNRNYPSGSWETIADSTPNDRFEPWLVGGPVTAHARMRISVINDTIYDESDSDFVVAGYLNLIEPNGYEVMEVGQADTIRWVGLGFDAVRIELNRSFPDGSWETIIDSTVNDGEYVWIVSEPVAGHCRIRMTALNDTMTDISEADFTIQPYLNLIAPNGGEQWDLSQPHTILWTAAGVTMVRLELNRQDIYGSWVVLRDSTPNDGSETVSLAGQPSEYCRVRLLPVGGRGADTSAAVFTLFTLDGYLGLVHSSNPYISVAAWNAGMVDSMVVSPWYHLRNFGPVSIHVSPPAEPGSREFSRTVGCNTYFTLPAGQMSACSLRLIFNPQVEGIFHDTLRIQTDAANAVNDTVRIPLFGTMLSAPQSPEITIRSVGNYIRLNWRPVTQTIHGTPITISAYLIFCSATPDGNYQYLGSTLETSYIDANAASYLPTRYYQVVAFLGGAGLVESLPGGGRLSKAEVLSRLRGAVTE